MSQFFCCNIGFFVGVIILNDYSLIRYIAIYLLQGALYTDDRPTLYMLTHFYHTLDTLNAWLSMDS